jgi:hypothetical protein
MRSHNVGRKTAASPHDSHLILFLDLTETKYGYGPK